MKQINVLINIIYFKYPDRPKHPRTESHATESVTSRLHSLYLHKIQWVRVFWSFFLLISVSYNSIME